MTTDDAMRRINLLMSHAWMVRNFLKHAEEVQDDTDMLEVHRMIFDYLRALEPSFQRGDSVDYVRRAKGKLSKLRRVSEYFSANYKSVSDHTNYQMAALSLETVVHDLDDIFGKVVSGEATES